MAQCPNLPRFQRAAVQEACFLLSPGALGSGSSYIVSIHPGLIRPHAPVPQARRNFAVTLICNAFAVRERLGIPRDLPYFRLPHFHCMPPTRPRWCAVRSRWSRTAMPGFLEFETESPPTTSVSASNTRRVILFRGCIVLVMLRPASLPSPPDWLRQDEITCVSPCLLRYIVTPAFHAVRYRAALGVRLNGRTGNLPSLGLSPNKLRQLVRLHSNFYIIIVISAVRHFLFDIRNSTSEPAKSP